MSKSITITPEFLPIIENLSSVIISINYRILFLKQYDLIFRLEKENLKKLFSIFELLNQDPEHYLYSIKSLKENLKND